MSSSFPGLRLPIMWSSTASLEKGATSPPSPDPLSCKEMQERFYESGSCVQKNCAILVTME